MITKININIFLPFYHQHFRSKVALGTLLRSLTWMFTTMETTGAVRAVCRTKCFYSENLKQE